MQFLSRSSWVCILEWRPIILKVCSQNDGFVMGSLLSVIVSELYMQNYESINKHIKPQGI